jgi:hypothetical protein
LDVEIDVDHSVCASSACYFDPIVQHREGPSDAPEGPVAREPCAPGYFGENFLSVPSVWFVQ